MALRDADAGCLAVNHQSIEGYTKSCSGFTHSCSPPALCFHDAVSSCRPVKITFSRPFLKEPCPVMARAATSQRTAAIPAKAPSAARLSLSPTHFSRKKPVRVARYTRSCRGFTHSCLYHRCHPAWYSNRIRSGRRKLLYIGFNITFMNQLCGNFVASSSGTGNQITIEFAMGLVLLLATRTWDIK